MTNAQPTEYTPLQHKDCWGFALDPIHIGTGEFRLGRVDNTIVRDPGSNLPKIPGSSLAGVARAYTAMLNNSYRRADDGGKSCAGKGGPKGTDHCGKVTCPVCMAFGFSRDGDSFQGLAMLSDALLLFFPVSSAYGPLWVTSPITLNGAGFLSGADASQWNSALGNGCAPTDSSLAGPINLGWLYLPVSTAPSITLPLSLPPGLQAISNRIVIAPDHLFSHIVNDQLEVRTSVSINPETGAAAKGALFTAEAIPRGAVFYFRLSIQDPANFRVNKEVPYSGAWHKLLAKVTDGLNMMESLGVGGLNTRGFGRLKVMDAGSKL